MTRLPARPVSLVALASICLLSARAEAGDPLKPYVVLQLDTSSSMQNATGFGPPSCPGSTDTRLSHAKCAINNIANSRGDMVLALAPFRQSTTEERAETGRKLQRRQSELAGTKNLRSRESA